eukprot:13247464-Alexandrium_andersonii.AAC.1
MFQWLQGLTMAVSHTDTRSPVASTPSRLPMGPWPIAYGPWLPPFASRKAVSRDHGPLPWTIAVQVLAFHCTRHARAAA